MRIHRNKLTYWHCKYGHLSGLRRTIQYQGAEGLPPSYSILVHDNCPCIDCLRGKQQKKSHQIHSITVYGLGELLHLDLHYKSILSLQGNKHSVTLVEHVSGLDLAKYLSLKSNAGIVVRDAITMLERQANVTVKIIQCDGAKEFIEKKRK